MAKKKKPVRYCAICAEEVDLSDKIKFIRWSDNKFYHIKCCTCAEEGCFAFAGPGDSVLVIAGTVGGRIKYRPYCLAHGPMNRTSTPKPKATPTPEPRDGIKLDAWAKIAFGKVDASFRAEVQAGRD